MVTAPASRNFRDSANRLRGDAERKSAALPAALLVVREKRARRAAAAALDQYGFSDLEAALPRQHPEKMLQAVVRPLAPDADDGSRSWTVIAAAIGFTAVDAKLEPLIVERLDQTERHHDPGITVPHAVWVSRTESVKTKIVVAEHEGTSVIAASVTPLKEQAQ